MSGFLFLSMTRTLFWVFLVSFFKIELPRFLGVTPKSFSSKYLLANVMERFLVSNTALDLQTV